MEFGSREGWILGPSGLCSNAVIMDASLLGTSGEGAEMPSAPWLLLVLPPGRLCILRLRGLILFCPLPTSALSPVGKQGCASLLRPYSSCVAGAGFEARPVVLILLAHPPPNSVLRGL